MRTFVIWDWDGTLADTYPVTNGAYAYTFKKLGMEDQTISLAGRFLFLLKPQTNK